MLIYKYLYIILIGLFLTNCSKFSPPLPAPNNDWQEMGLKERVKYCFVKVFENNKSISKYPVYDDVYHFSQDGRLILSRHMTYPDGGCGATVLGNSTQAVVNKYKYYPNGTKAVFCYMEYYSSSFALMDKWLFDIEIHHAKGNFVKIQNLRMKQIQTYDSLKKIRITQSYSFKGNYMHIYEYHTEYDSSMHTSFFKEHYWSSGLDMKISGNIVNLKKLLQKKTFLDSTYDITYAIFNRRDSSMDTTTLFIPNPSHTPDTYKYDKYGNWTERILRYGGRIERKIEYW